MTIPTCSIIIPVIDQLKYTAECIASIRKQSPSIRYEIIVINNGSTDGTAEYLKNQSDIRTISFSENKGYAVANNEGAKIAQGEFLVFLNNDTIVQPGWLDALVDVARRTNVGVVGSKLIYVSSGLINHAGYVYNADLDTFYLIYQNFDPHQPCVNKEREFQALLGACILVPRKIFEQIGGFSDFGLEDVDLCLRIRSLGYKVIYTPRSVVLHHGSVTVTGTTESRIYRTTSKSFKEIWPKSKLIWDDKEYYAKDGYRMVSASGTSIALEDLRAESEEMVEKAQKLVNCGDLSAAEAVLERALDQDPYNENLYIPLTNIYVATKNSEKALKLEAKLRAIIDE